MNVYKGRRSCYYRREGILVTHDWQIPDMVMRDLRRGYTYDHECNVTKMDDDLAKARLAFLVRITGDELAREKARRYLHELKEGENVFIY
jgi:hypothetical protein